MSANDRRSCGIKLGKEDDYTAWSFKMQCLLNVEDCFDVVDSPREDTAAGKKKDVKALALIGLNVEDHLSLTLSNCSTAHEAWTTLQDKFKPKTGAILHRLRRELVHIKKQPSETIEKYVDRGIALFHDLTTAGHELPKTELVWSVIDGLPKDYDAIVTILEAGDFDVDIDKVRTTLVLTEKRLMEERPADSFALAAAAATVSCQLCGSPTHLANRCPQLRGTGDKGGNSGGTPRPTCDNCGRRGHSANECRQPKNKHLANLAY
jgi:hypothetical protein